MNFNLLIIAVFLLGAAAGALIVSVFHSANFARAREQFQAELEASVEAELNSRHGQATSTRMTEKSPSSHAA